MKIPNIWHLIPSLISPLFIEVSVRSHDSEQIHKKHDQQFVAGKFLFVGFLSIHYMYIISYSTGNVDKIYCFRQFSIDNVYHFLFSCRQTRDVDRSYRIRQFSLDNHHNVSYLLFTKFVSIQLDVYYI